LLYLVFFRFLPFDGIYSANRSVNLIPFKTIWGYLSGGSGISASVSSNNLLGNIVMFIPLGIYFQVFSKNKRWSAGFLPLIISTVAIELFQFISGVGSCDIDDIILNFIGGLIGISIYKALSLLIKEEHKLHGIISMLALLVGLPVFVILIVLVIFNWQS
jgi:glycopeptide antibiotics resistance protein